MIYGMVSGMAKWALGDRLTGAVSYRLRPSSGRAWGGTFNGQAWRCHLVSDVIQKMNPVAIVETGTYLGTTTEWLSSFQIPVWSCEASERNFGYARQRLSSILNVHLALDDSRAALRKFLDGPLNRDLNKPILFYLDAHWNEELPLEDEMEIIFNSCPHAIVIVDDFQVPDDPGYKFDDYGEGKALTGDYVAPCVERYNLMTMYPAVSSELETGAKRGCAVFATHEVGRSLVEAVGLLRQVDDTQRSER